MLRTRLARRESLPVLALTLLAFAAAAAMAWFVFEGLPHLEDEMAYLFQARVMARGALWAPVPDNAAPFWVPFVLTLGGRRFGKYPPGWPAVLAQGEHLVQGVGQDIATNAAHVFLQLRRLVLHLQEGFQRNLPHDRRGERGDGEFVMRPVGDADVVARVHERHDLAPDGGGGTLHHQHALLQHIDRAGGGVLVQQVGAGFQPPA